MSNESSASCYASGRSCAGRTRGAYALRGEEEEAADELGVRVMRYSVKEMAGLHANRIRRERRRNVYYGAPFCPTVLPMPCGR